jgi:hypothetical protein
MYAKRYVLVLALMAFSARAAEVTLASKGSIAVEAVAVHAKRVDRAAGPVEQQMRIGSANELALAEGIWELSVASDTVWAPVVYVRNDEAVTIPLWPAATIRAKAKDIDELSVAFTPLDEAAPRGEATCRAGEEAWSCTIPRGRFDLRFSTPGSAPEYRFAASEETYALQFVAGASLSGRIDGSRGISLENVELTLGTYKTKSNAKGFFQFKGLAPGEYSLRAQHRNLTAQARSVKIIAGMAAELATPLLLDHPKKLTVTLTPALDPDLQPWRVSLWSFVSGRLVSVSESAATAAGEWSMSGLVAGDYRVQVSRASGERWKSQDVTIGITDATLSLPLLGEHITGVITLGDRPIAASLSFGGEGGQVLHAADDGTFEGDIVPDDTDERVVLIDAEALQVVRTVRAKLERTESGTRVAIHLPNTTLIGRVVRTDGAPQANAIVTVSGAGGVVQAFSKNDGSFQLTGLDADVYRVMAETADAKSDSPKVSVSTDVAAEVELVLLDQVVVRGQVAAARTPVVQAEAYAIPRDTQWAPFMPHATTTDLGRFQLELPPRTSVYDLVVVHPAFDVALSRVAVKTDSVQHVVATQVGGTLVTETKSPSDVLLRHAGGECWATWLATRAGGAVEAQRVSLPRLEPGEYSVCSAKTNRCASGYLPPLGQLTLTVD